MYRQMSIRCGAIVIGGAYAYHMLMSRRETLVQLTDQLVVKIDSLAASRELSRSELIRQVLAAFVEREDHEEKVRRDIEGYTKFPPTDEFDAWHEESARAMVEEEPWERPD